MDLILWRHAQAEDPAPGASDRDRALTPKGLKQAKEMARWLRTRLPHDTHILVSPARRTIQTADALAMPYHIEEKAAPEVPLEILQRALSQSPSKRPVLIVGHQPTLGQLVSSILQSNIYDWPIKKGAIIWLSSDKVQKPFIKALIGPELV